MIVSLRTVFGVLGFAELPKSASAERTRMMLLASCSGVRLKAWQETLTISYALNLGHCTHPPASQRINPLIGANLKPILYQHQHVKINIQTLRTTVGSGKWDSIGQMEEGNMQAVGSQDREGWGKVLEGLQ